MEGGAGLSAGRLFYETVHFISPGTPQSPSCTSSFSALSLFQGCLQTKCRFRPKPEQKFTFSPFLFFWPDLCFFLLNIEPSIALNFHHSALFCLDFLRAECHWRVNYVYAFSPLYFSPPPPFSLPCRMCACVCLQTNVCKLCFPFEHPFDVAVYLFISLPAKASSQRLGLRRIERA